jgi:hypothetical protein
MKLYINKTNILDIFMTEILDVKPNDQIHNRVYLVIYLAL